MTKNIYSSVISRLIEREHLAKEDKEAYIYALEIMVHGAVNMLATIAIGLLFNMPAQSLCMFLSFFLVRKFAGGLHCNKYSYCFLASTAISAAMLLIVKYSWFGANGLFVALLAAAIALISALAPAEHPNKPLTQREKKVYRAVACVLSLVLSAAGLLLTFAWGKASVGYALSSGVILSGVLMTSGKITYRKSKQPQTDSENTV